jgi:lipid-A-disaccharide synthase
MLGVPEVVCYRFSLVSALAAGLVVRVKFISLVNLILDRKAVPELIQFNFTPDALSRELALILPDGEARSKMLDDYKELREKVGTAGASARAAAIMVANLRNSPGTKGTK